MLKLSASYAKPTDEPELELVCTVHNINPNKDTGLLKRCTVLDEYTRFVEIVRKYEKDNDETPIENAIDYCVRNHILEEFLKERRAEVLKAMTIDMTFERREGLIREEEREYGRAEGRKEGRTEGREEERADINNLYAWLFSQNRTADVQRATTDPEYLDTLMDEYKKAT